MYFVLLDVLRFLSALGVMTSHLFSFDEGRLGVYLFFIISGFVIYFSFHNDIKDYVVSRFLRLFPLFWFCCTLTYLTTVFFGNNLPLERYFVSMLLVNDGKILQMVDGSYWTLTFEVLFYIYIGVFVWLFTKERLVWFYSLWLTITICIFIFGLENFFVSKLLCVRLAPYFIFGGVLGLCVETFRNSRNHVKGLYLALLFLSALSPIFISYQLRVRNEGLTNTTALFTSGELITVEFFFLLVLVSVYLSLKPFFSKEVVRNVCVALGGITYPFYLLHSKIGETILLAYDPGYHGQVAYYSVYMVVLLLLISYQLSIYDSQMRKMLRRKFVKKSAV